MNVVNVRVKQCFPNHAQNHATLELLKVLVFIKNRQEERKKARERERGKK